MGSEKNFERKVRQYIERRGGYVVKQFGCSFSKAGIPDLLCCINGHFVGLEIKSATGRPTPLQEYNVNKIIKSGGHALILYPKDWEQFQQLIEDLMQDVK